MSTSMFKQLVGGEKLDRQELMDWLSRSGPFCLAGVNFDEDLLFSTHYLRPGNVFKYLPSSIRWYSKVVAVYVDFTETYYLDRRECEVLASGLIDHMLHEPDWMSTIVAHIVERSRLLCEVSSHASSIGHVSASDEQLLAILDHLDLKTNELYEVARIPEALDRGTFALTNYLKNHLAITLGMGEESEAAFWGLTNPPTRDVFSKEVLEFDEIVCEVASQPALVERLVSGDTAFFFWLPASLRLRLRDHARRWGIVGYHGYRVRRRLDLNDYTRRLRLEILLRPARGWKREASSESLRSTQWARNRLDLPHIRLFEHYGIIGCAKQNRKLQQLFAFEARDIVIAELSLRLGAPEAVVRCLLPNELREVFRDRKQLSDKHNSRPTGCIYLRFGDEEAVVYGDWVRDWSYSWLPSVNVSPSGSYQAQQAVTLTGQIACPGRATGRCRVVTRGGFLRVPVGAGDIVVAEATDPDMLPSLQHVAGVVTEQGGVTCHAAVVCRELGIPALVGVQGALAAARECSEVILDSSAGRVTFIQQQSPMSVPGLRLQPLTSKTEHCGCRAGPKAEGLVQVRRFGFSVPSFWEACSCRLRALAEGGEWEKVNDLVASASKAIGLEEGDTFAIRSNAWIENGQFPGRFFSAVDVQPRFVSLALIDFLHRNDCLAIGGRYEGTIIIQLFIKAELAGIASTADAPQGRLLVEAVSGSNLALTSGRASPIQISLNLPRGAADGAHETHQPQACRSLPTELERELRTLGALSTEFGTSFRVEWCWSGNRLWLLQANRIVQPSDTQGLLVNWPDVQQPQRYRSLH